MPPQPEALTLPTERQSEWMTVFGRDRAGTSPPVRASHDRLGRKRAPCHRRQPSTDLPPRPSGFSSPDRPTPEPSAASGACHRSLRAWPRAWSGRWTPKAGSPSWTACGVPPASGPTACWPGSSPARGSGNRATSVSTCPSGTFWNLMPRNQVPCLALSQGLGQEGSERAGPLPALGIGLSTFKGQSTTSARGGWGQLLGRGPQLCSGSRCGTCYPYPHRRPRGQKGGGRYGGECTGAGRVHRQGSSVGRNQNLHERVHAASAPQHLGGHEQREVSGGRGRRGAANLKQPLGHHLGASGATGCLCRPKGSAQSGWGSPQGHAEPAEGTGQHPEGQ